MRLRRVVDEQGTISTRNENSVPVKMALADEEGYPHDGVVNYFDNQLDPSTGTLQARGVFDNADRMLSPGMFVRVRLPIGQPYRALLLSEQALGTDQGQKFVYVIDEQNKAQYRRVAGGQVGTWPARHPRRHCRRRSRGRERVAARAAGVEVNPKLAAATPPTTEPDSQEVGTAASQAASHK